MVINRHMVLPTSVFTQKSPVPTDEDIIAQSARFNPCLIDADKIAIEAGSSLSQNVVILGAASWSIPLKAESLLAAVKKLVPKKTVEINAKAFEMGRAFSRTR